MKQFIFTLIASMVLVGCSNPNTSTITFDDEKTIAIRQHFQNYLNNDVDAMATHWSDDLIVSGSSIEGTVGLDDAKGVIGLHHMLFSDISITAPGQEGDLYAETTYYAESGETWTKTWYSWKGTGKFTGNKASDLSMSGFRWEDGKIVEEVHFGDGSSVETELFAYQLAQTKD